LTQRPICSESTTIMGNWPGRNRGSAATRFIDIFADGLARRAAAAG
jgi:hypothetical protein